MRGSLDGECFSNALTLPNQLLAAYKPHPQLGTLMPTHSRSRLVVKQLVAVLDRVYLGEKTEYGTDGIRARMSYSHERILLNYHMFVMCR